jgi:hypothetical protein
MIEYKQLGQGIWHVTKFFDNTVWTILQESIVALADSDFSDDAPYRLRLSLVESKFTDISNVLVDYQDSLKPLITQLTDCTQLNSRLFPFLWRDQENFHCWWHPDDYTRKPTIQIYVNGPEEYGTEFQIDGKTVTLPFVPNSGYLMDNQHQPIHGMTGTVGKNMVRQSIYLIY